MVSLIGGGPGAVDLITVKGQKRIREADCIIYDRLSSPELLREAKRDCELIYVGKENRNHTMEQEEINQLLVEKAIQYANVVRLKGGDPYVFGRGGEEALALREKKIPFEIVPGISSAIAGLAYAGIPVTHRGVASGFHVVTAHNRMDELADIDFSAMARGTDTCVFLMGLSKVGEIADRLIEAGMAPQTGAAVISRATTCMQRTCTAPLFQIAEAVKKEKLPSPALIVVGDVVKLREQLNFFEERELFGRHYLVTKVGRKESRLAKLLREKGAEVSELLVGEIKSRDVTLSKEALEAVDYLVFTSANGVEAFFTNLKRSGLDTRSLWHCKVASIGEKTSLALSKYGICPDVTSPLASGKSLGETLAAQLKGTERLWYVKAEETDDALKKLLNDKSNYNEIVFYENVEALEPGVVKKVLEENFDGVFFTCASSVRRFFAQIAGDDIPGRGVEEMNFSIPCYSIGEKTTEALKDCGVNNIVQAASADFEALAECVCHATIQN